MLDFPKIEFHLLSIQKRKVRIYIFFHVSVRKKFKSPLPLYINPSFWDTKKQEVISSYKLSKKINENLKIIRDQLEKREEIEYLNDNKSLKYIVKVLSNKYLIDNSLTIKSACQRYINLAPTKKNNRTGSIGLKLNTIKRYEYFKKIYEKFEKEKDLILFIDDFRIQDIDLLTTYLLKEKNYGVGTVGKQMGLLKTILNRAKRDGYSVSDNIQYIDSFGLDKNKRILHVLSLEEIELLKNFTPEPYLKNSWKWMLIGLYTGQRVSDLLSLKRDQIRKGENGKLYIDFKQQKTGIHVTVGVSDPLVIDILLNDFPEFSYTQIFNLHIKKICELAGITKKVVGYKMNAAPRRKLKGTYRKCDLIAAHDLRRSFATNYYGKVQTPILMKITGHKRESTFLDYIGENFNQDYYADLFLEQMNS